MDINKLHNIYFLGIGGIGMSALACYFNSRGVKVCGYDKTQTPLTLELKKEGIDIHYEDDVKFIPEQIDMVCYTPAIPKDNKEFNYFIDKGYVLIKRSELLGYLTKDKFTIAVAGTHGKTSITSLIAHIFKNAGKNVTAFIGGISRNYNTNLVLSQPTDIMVAEADEYDRSFLTLNPDITVISSMDADHLDIYGSKQKMNDSFMEFIGKIKKENGCLIIKKNLPYPENIDRLRTYSLDSASDNYADNIRIENFYYKFDIISGTNIIKDISFSIPGRHNIENAVAAAAVAFEEGLTAIQIKNGIETYKGVVRRFDYRVNKKDVVYIDDYAHHPEELRACISAVRELYDGRNITGIFQPHLFSRTRDFADEFASVLGMLDALILLDIYPAREKPIPGITSKIILNKVSIKDKLLCSKDEVLEVLKKRNTDVLLTLGAGDIDTLVGPIEKYLLNKK